MKNSKSKAFTLAEVLITLGIIGVVAAMTIPNLITNYKAHQLRSQFLKAYSLTQQAFKLMENDDVSLDPASYGQDTINKFYKTYMKYFQGVLDCGSAAYGLSNKLPCYPINQKPYITFDGTKQIIPQYFDDGQFVLQDGTLFLLENQAGSPRLWIFVDINGYINPPNRWGYDLFTFQFIDGELRTMGSMGTTYTGEIYCSKNSTNDLNGIACANKAKENSDYFKILLKK